MNMKLIMTSIAVSSLLAALAIAQPPRHTPRYTVTDLGTLPGGTFSQAASVNTNSLVSGVASAPDGTQHAVLWQGRRSEDEEGEDRQDHGTQHAVLRQGRRIIDITKPGIGGLNSGAFGVNERGQAAVQAETSALDPNGEDFCGYGTHLICLPFLWQNGAVTPLPTAVMYCAVVGSSEATKLLVHHGAEMNERNVFRSMALMWSVTNREKVCLQAVSRRSGTKVDQDLSAGVGISAA